MAKHEFGIIDYFEENKWYSEYEPEKYDCVSVGDELIEEIIAKYGEELTAIKTYYQVSAQAGSGAGLLRRDPYSPRVPRAI